jgi:hypothetical protein
MSYFKIIQTDQTFIILSNLSTESKSNKELFHSLLTSTKKLDLELAKSSKVLINFFQYCSALMFEL